MENEEEVTKPCQIHQYALKTPEAKRDTTNTEVEVQHLPNISLLQ